WGRCVLIVEEHEGSAEGSVTGVQSGSLFFSSRRRHTRLVSDWSSDVCSSDLKQKTAYEIGQCLEFRRVLFRSQAEDGIRDWSVTGVQTCALPIYKPHVLHMVC